MKKKTFIKVLSCSLLFGCLASTASLTAIAFASGVDFSKDIIKPLSHIRGEEVNTLPLHIQDLFKLENPYDPENVWSLYNSTPEMDSSYWTNISTKEYRLKYPLSGTTNIVAYHNGTTINVPVLYTDSGKYDQKTNLSLTCEGQYQTTYKVGDSFDTKNLSVKLHYYNPNFAPTWSLKDVTNLVVWSQEKIVADQKVFTGSYEGLTVEVPIIVQDSYTSTKIMGYTFSGNYQVLYKDNEAFNRDGLMVIAHYEDGHIKDVTNELTWQADEFDAIRNEKSAKEGAYFDRLDDFYQINNILKWEPKDASVVESYDVLVSMNQEMTQVVYKGHVTEPMYKMMDIYTGRDYYWQVKSNLTDSTSVKSPIYHFKTAATPRTVYIQGVSNTRDIGGSKTPFGEFKEGYIYRGARIDEITDAGLEVFKNKLGIQTDVDLRTGSTEVGHINTIGLPYYVGPIDLGMYQLFDPLLVTGQERAFNLAKLRNALEPFTHEENYPIYFHCSVGRDRTGTLGSIIDALMGVDQKEILQKYLISVFSVNGHYDLKNYRPGILNGVALITMLNNHKGNTIYEKAESLVKEAGLTDAQIQKIRDILTGKTNAKNSLKFLDNDDNYEGQVVINFRQAGNDEETLIVAPNTVVTSPFALKEGYAWFNGNEIVDLSKPVKKSMTLVSKKVEMYNVTIHYVNGEKADVTKAYPVDTVISISDYKIDGLEPTAYLDTGKQISKYKVSRDAVINLIF